MNYLRIRIDINKNGIGDSQHLMRLMCYLLALYKKPDNTELKCFFEIITAQNNPFNQKYIPQDFSITTLFDFSKRAFVNFLVLHNLLTMHSDLVILTVGDFITRAEQYLNITLHSDVKYNRMPIATTRKISPSEFKHEFCFLGRGGRQNINVLFDLYNQLLTIIFSSSHADDSESIKIEETKRLNAIFLLIFLIGSNPPVYSKKNACQGGAFITDIMLTLILKSAGFIPIRKNFLNLSEVELLFLYADNSQASWLKPIEYYQEACKGLTNKLFHPHSSDEYGIMYIDFLRIH